MRDRLDEERIEILRSWGLGLASDDREELRAAGKAITVLIEEIDRIQVDLWNARVVEPDVVEIGHKTLRLLQQRRTAVHLARELGSQHGRKVRVHVNARHESVLPAEQFSRVGHPSRQSELLEQEVRRRHRRAQDGLADGILHHLDRGQ